MATVSLQTYKVLSQELSSSVKFDNLVQAVEDGINDIEAAKFGVRASAAEAIVRGIITGDTVARFAIQSDGELQWGPGGGAARDTTLERITANQLVLGTGDSLTIGDATHAGGNYIQFFEQTADPPAAPANGARLFAKDNGAGKTQLVVRFATGAVQVIVTEP